MLSKSLKNYIKSESALAANCFVVEERLTEAEKRFVERAKAKFMMVIHRPSWPDFLLMVDGKLIGVEVKSKGDRISRNQRRTFNLLENEGILKIFIWSAATPDRLIPWKRVKNPLAFHKDAR